MTKTDPTEAPLDGTIPRTCSDERPGYARACNSNMR